MQVIVRPRQAGKTTDLIRLASEKWYYIISPNKIQAGITFKMAGSMGLDIPFPLTWYEFVNKNYYGRKINGFVIDNLDMCLQQETSVPIKVVSLSEDKDEKNPQPR